MKLKTDFNPSLQLRQFLISEALRIKSTYFTSMFSWIVVYTLPLIVGSLTASLIAKATGKSQSTELWSLLVLIFILLIIRSVVLLFSLSYTYKIIFKSSSYLKIKTFAGLLNSAETLEQTGTGEVINRLRDDTDEIGGLLEWTTDLIYRTVLTIGAVFVLFKTDLIMTVPLLLLLVGFFISTYFKKKISFFQFETRTQQGKIGEMIADSLQGIRDLRLTGSIENKMAQMTLKFGDRRNVLIRQQIFTDLLSDLFRNLILIGTSIVLLTIGLRIHSSPFDPGKLILFLTYSTWLAQQMYFFGKILARFQRGKVSFTRLHELSVEDSPSSTANLKLSPLSELVVENLTTLNPSGGILNEPVSFSLVPGKMIAITGEVGSGKSTFLKTLLGQNPAALGRIFWNGREITSDPNCLRSPRVALARQSARFLRGTLEENITLGKATLTQDQLLQVMKDVQLETNSDELPNGLKTMLDSGAGGQLSGGQRQRLALARMFSRQADIFIVDDCDSSLDRTTAQLAWKAMRSSQPNAAWIVVSQNPDLLASADQIIILNRAIK